MKANEAPEKIILSADRDTQIIHDEWVINDYTDNIKIEYVRTDAFIENAVNYLNSKLYDWMQTTNPNQRSYANTIMKQNFIDDFKKYMKGE